MTVLFDTNVWIAALRPAHAEHARCAAWHARLKAGTFDGVLPAHGLAELYNNLTKLRLPVPVPPLPAKRLIAAEVLPFVRVVALDDTDYLKLIDDAAAAGLAGSIIYDALLCAAGAKAGADRLVTLNLRHFRRVWPGPPAAVVEP